MRAYVLTNPSQLEAIDVPSPSPTDVKVGQAVIKTLAGGICGTDIPLFRGGAFHGFADKHHPDEVRFGPRPPAFPMHEVVGVVEESRCSLAVGTRVVGWAFENQGLAERVIVDESSVVAIPATCDPVAQLVLQPLACVMHTLDRVGRIEGKRAAVLGQGPIGLLFSEVLHARGASHVTGVDRIDRAGPYSFGADEKALNATDGWAYGAVKEGDLYDIVIEAIGHHSGPLNHAIEVAAREGVIYAFGGIDEQMYPLEMRTLQRNQLTLMSGNTPLKYRVEALKRATEYLLKNPALMDKFVTDVFPAEEAQRAYETAGHVIPGRIKVAIEWK